jgi:uncharacterized membrane protein
MTSSASQQTLQAQPLFRAGRYFFATGIAFFGFQYFFQGHYLGGLPPIPPWAPGGAAEAYLVGVILLAAAVGMLTSSFGRVSSLVVGGLFLVSVLILHTPHMHDIIFSGTDRTRAIEPLSLAAAAFVLASLLAPGSGGRDTAGSDALLRNAGLILFALILPIYGWQHFEYLRFLVTLVPNWMPAHAFLIGFTGAAFVAAGLAILFRVLARTAAVWLGIMFLSWTILLHAPRVAHNLHNADEWTSTFVALAMCGASWIVATAATSRS